MVDFDLWQLLLLNEGTNGCAFQGSWSLSQQIECSSISDYAVKIVKANKLEDGKYIFFFWGGGGGWGGEDWKVKCVTDFLCPQL